MRAIRLKKPGRLDALYADDAIALEPGAGEIIVRIRASSLNYHDYVVVQGWLPSDDGRIPISDGAGEVMAVGAGVTEFKIGDPVVSAFFPE